jgi:molecular chaperone DnaK
MLIRPRHVCVIVSLPFLTMNSSGPQHLTLSLSRSQLVALLSPALSARLQTSCAATLTESHVLQHVLLVGGGARMPMAVEASLRAVKGGRHAQTMVHAVTACKEPENVVATGANYFVSRQ